uniref:Uncharacterized protein n=1 Tax=Anguilla anguilla TaxID=7936 RepID=A0A0E9RA87_ANGAN
MSNQLIQKTDNILHGFEKSAYGYFVCGSCVGGLRQELLGCGLLLPD